MSPATRSWREVSPDLFRFTTTDLHDLHVAIMEAFEDAAVMNPSLNLEQVRSGLVAQGWDEPLDDADLYRSLKALVDWSLLDATQDHSARYATPEEFERRNLQWALTARGQAAISGVLHALQVLRQTVSLQPAVLDAIADALVELHELMSDPGADDGRISTRLAEVEGHLQSLVANVRQFNGELQRLTREDATSDDVFLDIKRQTVNYLQEYITGVERPVRRVVTGIGRIEAGGVALLLDRALAGANLAPTAEDPRPRWLAERSKHWDALRAWFMPADGAEPRIRDLLLVARRAIGALLQVLERRWEARRRSASIAEDFRALARWFARSTDEAEAHRLFNAAFGLWPSRHAHLAHEEEAVPSTASWSEAAPVIVAATLRTSGSLSNRGRARAVADTRHLRARRQREQAEALARSLQVRAGLATEGVVHLSTLARLDTEAFDELLALLGQALGTNALSDGTRRALSADGQVEIVLKPAVDGHKARLVADSGVLTSPDFAVEITCLGVDVLEPVREEASASGA